MRQAVTPRRAAQNNTVCLNLDFAALTLHFHALATLRFLDRRGGMCAASANPSSTPQGPSGAPERLAVLGGGMSTLSFLFELTSSPSWRERYDITLYQSGWRLGGQIASSRNLSRSARNEEHGLHLWFGFYSNAFRVLREVYAELDRGPEVPFARLEQAFVPQDTVAFHESDGAWLCRFPSDGTLPGRGLPLHSLTTVAGPRSYLVRGLQVLLGEVKGEPNLEFLRTDQTTRRPTRLARVLRRAATASAVARAACDLREALDLAQQPPSRSTDQRIVKLLRRFRAWARRVLRPTNPDRRVLFVLVDFSTTALLGTLRDDVLRKGFDSLDALDFREWLARHEVSDEVLASGPMAALYDASFSYLDGHSARPALAAGAALLTVMRMLFAYEGAIMWRPVAGLGELVVAPLYEVLARRGVRFAFFHRVQELEVDPSTRSVTAVHLHQQARLSADRYEPLVMVNGVACWPSTPLWRQLDDADVLRGVDLEHESGPLATPVVLRCGVDVDHVVCGLNLAALREVAEPLAVASPRWRDAFRHLTTVSTKSVQLWFNASAEALGWPHGPTVQGAAGRVGSWIDMSSATPYESWREPPQLSLYGCAHAPSDLTLDALHHEVEQALRTDLRRFLPGVPEAAEHEHLRLNHAPADRYVQATPNTAHTRIPAGSSGFRNLTLCGVWTHTGFHIASIESAVMSGLMACRALTGAPQRIVGERLLELDA